MFFSLRMFRYFLLLLVLASSLSFASEDWVLVFKDDFKGSQLNTKKWSRIEYEKADHFPDWEKYQSREKELLKMNGNSISLWGRFGKYKTMSNQTERKETLACAGIYTKNTFTFQYGKVEVRARFDCVKGCWPAIWMLPLKGGWPGGGEIDILEHLNFENKVYQTLHLNGDDGNHRSVGAQPAIEGAVDGYHVYTMEWTPEAITFYLDGKQSGRFDKNTSTNWPFDDENHEFYLLIDQQVEGAWVGQADRETLRKKGAALEVDYVKIYADKKYKPAKPKKKKKKQ